MSDKQLREAIEAEFGDQYGVNGEGWRGAPLDHVQRIEALRTQSRERRDLRQRACMIVLKTYGGHGQEPQDQTLGPVLRGAARFLRWVAEQDVSPDAAMSVLEAVQEALPRIFPDDLERSAQVIIDYCDSGDDRCGEHGGDDYAPDTSRAPGNFEDFPPSEGTSAGAGE